LKLCLKKAASYIPALVLLIILCAGFIVSVGDLPTQTLCIYKRLFQIDCPGCGLTRAFLLIPKGHFLQALQLNAASVALYFLFILMLLTLISRMFHFKAHDHSGFKRFRFYLSQLVLVLIVGHWAVKIANYFSNHSLLEYGQELINTQNFWLLWV